MKAHTWGITEMAHKHFRTPQYKDTDVCYVLSRGLRHVRSRIVVPVNAMAAVELSGLNDIMVLRLSQDPRLITSTYNLTGRPPGSRCVVVYHVAKAGGGTLGSILKRSAASFARVYAKTEQFHRCKT